MSMRCAPGEPQLAARPPSWSHTPTPLASRCRTPTSEIPVRSRSHAAIASQKTPRAVPAVSAFQAGNTPVSVALASVTSCCRTPTSAFSTSSPSNAVLVTLVASRALPDVPVFQAGRTPTPSHARLSLPLKASLGLSVAIQLRCFLCTATWPYVMTEAMLCLPDVWWRPGLLLYRFETFSRGTCSLQWLLVNGGCCHRCSDGHLVHPDR